MYLSGMRIKELSIVIPLFNEAESLPELMLWIDKALKGREYEVIFVDDGSRDNSWSVIEEISVQYPDIVKGLKKLINLNADYIFTATTFSYPIKRALSINQGKGVSMLFPDFKNIRSQDIDEAYHDAGQFYWGTASAWLKSKPIFGENSAIVKLPRAIVQDIDTLEDWEQAELKYRLMESTLLNTE